MNRPTLFRLYRILGIFKERIFVSLKEIADDLELHPKTINRDLDLLRYQMRVPIEYDSRRKKWHIAKNYDWKNLQLPQIGFSQEDFRNLMAGFEILEFLKPYPGEKIVQRAIEALELKMETYFPAIKIKFISIDIGSTVIAQDKQKVKLCIQILEKAISANVKVAFSYYSPYKNKESRRKVWPLHLHNNCGRWFLLAYDEKRKDLRLFCLDRMKKLKEVGEEFYYKEKVDFDKYCRQSFRNQLEEKFKVKVKFDEYQSRWIRTQHWFDDQKIKELKNGETEMTFSFSGVEDFKRWFLKYGSHAEVLGPDWLRKEMKKEIKKMLDKY